MNAIAFATLILILQRHADLRQALSSLVAHEVLARGRAAT